MEEGISGYRFDDAPAPADDAKPEFKDSVGNVFDADGALIRREDGFEGLTTVLG